MATKTYIVVYSDADMTMVQKVALNDAELTQLSNLRKTVKQCTTGASLTFFALDEMGVSPAADVLTFLARTVAQAAGAGK